MKKDSDASQKKPTSSVEPFYPDEIVLRRLPPQGVKLDANVYVKMRDGVKVAVDIYSPVAKGRYPAILSMSPYLKEIQQQPPEYSHFIEAAATDFYVPKGYVHVIAQIRGSGFSQGQYNFWDIVEQRDGYDLVEWIAQQPWCNGNVGMMGLSYFAMIQWLVAAQKPPHLRCIVPVNGMTDFYRGFMYPGGTLRSGFVAPLAAAMISMCVWPGPVDGKLPPANFFADLASHPEDGPYYWERSGWTKLDDIDIPVLNVVVQLNFIHSCSQLDSHSRLKGPKKLLVVPPAGWFSHLQFLRNRPFNEQILRWLDHWLKGIDTGIMDEPPVAIYDTGKEEWRYENEYPLARTEWKKFYLHSSSKGPATEPPYGLISTEPPGREEPDRYVSPESISLLREGKPVLTYATPPLDADITVWGPLGTVIYGSSTGLDTTWFVKLRDVGPDGKVTLLSQGNLKASYREVDKGKSKPGQPFHQFQNPVLLEPDTVYEFQIEMVPIFYTFKKGHRIWVHIASDDPSFYAQFHLLPIHAENTIYHDKTYPSHLVLPVIPDAPVVKSVGPPLSEINWTVIPGTGTPFAPFFTGTPHT